MTPHSAAPVSRRQRWQTTRFAHSPRVPYTKKAANFGRGLLAQLVRAPALQAGCRGFESLTAHQNLSSNQRFIPKTGSNKHPFGSTEKETEKPFAKSGLPYPPKGDMRNPSRQFLGTPVECAASGWSLGPRKTVRTCASIESTSQFHPGKVDGDNVAAATDISHLSVGPDEDLRRYAAGL